jgi:HEPN domain-containing protein
VSCTKPGDAAPWIKKAEEDWRVARKLDAETESDSICFHAQQCAEKYLKAFLELHRRHFPKTHDLMVLLNICLPLEKSHRALANALSDLNPYSVIARYPGLETTPDEARRARIAVRKVRAIMRIMMGVSGKKASAIRNGTRAG